jgi:hypothetical protein
LLKEVKGKNKKKLIFNPENTVACSSKTYKIKQYGNPTHKALNKEIL